MLFENSEEKAKMLKTNNITLSGLSREYLLRTYSIEVADKIYPQYKYENTIGTSKISDDRSLEISQCLFLLLDTKGYATASEICSMLKEKYSYRSTEVQIKKSLTEILLSYGLKRIRANKGIKEKYNIDGNGYPNIIIHDM